MRKLSGFYSPGSSMAYPQGYLYQPSASLALYSCPAYSTSVISGPRTEELGRSSSGSAFAPYAGSTAFTSASPGYNSHLPYSADAAAAATFTSYVVSKLKVITAKEQLVEHVNALLSEPPSVARSYTANLKGIFSPASSVWVLGNIPRCQVCWLIKCCAIRVKWELLNEGNFPSKGAEWRALWGGKHKLFTLWCSRWKKLKYCTLGRSCGEILWGNRIKNNRPVYKDCSQNRRPQNVRPLFYNVTFFDANSLLQSNCKRNSCACRCHANHFWRHVKRFTHPIGSVNKIGIMNIYIYINENI